MQRDRLTSLRKSAVKKEKPLIQHPIDSQASVSELPVAQPLIDERSMNLSEKEVMDLFEKMMVSSLLLVILHMLQYFWIVLPLVFLNYSKKLKFHCRGKF